MGIGKKVTGRNQACYTAAAGKKPSKGERVNSTTRRTSSDFLFARPSFISGAARLVDFGAAFDAYNSCQTPQEADARALASDWLSVGDDISAAIEDLKREIA